MGQKAARDRHRAGSLALTGDPPHPPPRRRLDGFLRRRGGRIISLGGHLPVRIHFLFTSSTTTMAHPSKHLHLNFHLNLHLRGVEGAVTEHYVGSEKVVENA